MRRAAAFLSLAVFAFALAVPSMAAQPPTYSQAYQLRAGLGDIPTTAATEAAGSWNVEQRLEVQFDNATEVQYGFELPAGATLAHASCTCGVTPDNGSAGVGFTVPSSTPSGTYTMTVLSTQAAGDVTGFSLDVPRAAGNSRVAIVYVPLGQEASAASEPSRSLPSTSGAATILEFTEVPSPFWVAVHPAAQAGGDSSGPASGPSGINPWLMLAVGVALGAIAWAFLVSRGAVQAKGRKQVAATAAHVEAAANDPPAVLEGKKRALLAALKEIEVAKMNNEMPNDVYDSVKADLKKQAVTVMRALETSTAAGEAGKSA
jgi:hypothetical protein